MSIIKGNLPFRFLENKYFQQFISLINSSYKLPNRHDMANTILNRVFEATSAKLRNELNSALVVAITTDCWTSVQDLSYLGLTCHYIDQNFELRNGILTIKHVNGSTAEELKTCILDILKDWNVITKTICIVADNEPTMVSCVAQLKEDILNKYAHKFGFFFGVNCLGHVLHLVVTKIFELNLNDSPNLVKR